MGKLYKVGQSKKKQAIFSVRTYEKLNNAKAVLNFADFMNLDFFWTEKFSKVKILSN